VKVFVSHSKYDIEIRKFFSEIFAMAGIVPKYMEFEDLDGKYAGVEIANKIKHPIDGSSAVFVLLGKNVENPQSGSQEFTHNWVSFEVGVAAGSNKPVWVFEQFNQFTRFPIPYVTDYCRYTLDYPQHVKNMKELLKNKIVNKINVKPIAHVQCLECYSEYNLWDSVDTLYCPVCRKNITLNKQKT
jgi:hypothetical protein